jgi:hypothetical protein
VVAALPEVVEFTNPPIERPDGMILDGGTTPDAPVEFMVIVPPLTVTLWAPDATDRLERATKTLDVRPGEITPLSPVLNVVAVAPNNVICELPNDTTSMELAEKACMVREATELKLLSMIGVIIPARPVDTTVYVEPDITHELLADVTESSVVLRG